MALPLAYFLTWTTYGTWLPGDERCSVNRLANWPGAERVPPHDGLKNYAVTQMNSPAFVLDENQRTIVQAVIKSHCEKRGWELLAVNCRTNHVHVVVKCGDIAAKIVRNQFKSYATRALRDAGLTNQQQVWTKDGSDRMLWNERAVSAAVEYVLNQ
ncbi:MAG: hypothetical protein EHM48_09775 [Planctomycetaceae bacterium]|nr:MAG: hypothetical protein EHM48_09775 [Planctomycetaceae bacterium]